METDMLYSITYFHFIYIENHYYDNEYIKFNIFY